MASKQPLAVFGLMLFCLAAMQTDAQANIVLTFFPASDFNSNTTLMDTTLGLTGYTIDGFESTTLIPGLTISLSGGVPSTTWASLPNLFNENTCGNLTQNAAWDGTDTVINIPTNSMSNCSSPANIANVITFNYAPGTTSFGLGMGNFQSLDTPPNQFPITNHELFVNGVEEGVLETLAGANWTPGLQRNAYLRIDATGGTTITSVGFENISAPDVLMLDHLAVLPAAAEVPEPRMLWFVLGGLLALALVRGHSLRHTRI
jgi:hypothetical protein